jgi:hypothetical protein
MMKSSSSSRMLALGYPTQREVAHLLGINQATVSRRIAAEDLPTVSIGARDRRTPPATVVALNNLYGLRTAQQVSEGLTAIARRRAPALAGAIATGIEVASAEDQGPPEALITAPHPSGRAYIGTYANVRRREHHDFIEAALTASGNAVVYRTPDSIAPAYMAIEEPDGRRTGLIVYGFMATRRETRNRPKDESRLQIRYGDVNDPAWRLGDHPVAFDPAGVDLTVMLGVAPAQGLLVALDPLLYDPLPLGISVFWKDDEVAEAQAHGWYAWERDNIRGVRRDQPRTEGRSETLVAFAPERITEFLRFEREAQSLALDPALRLAAARRDRSPGAGSTALPMHDLEQAYGLPASVILDLIRDRNRVAMAVRGGVAEYHLGEALRRDPNVLLAEPGQQEGPPDYFVTLRDGRQVTVECKNASPNMQKRDPVPRVEVQKTRVSRNDPTSRRYRVEAFDVLAACMYGPTNRWNFQFQRTQNLERDKEFPDRIHYMQRIDGFYDSLSAALGL